MLRGAFCLFTRSVKALMNFCHADCTDLASAQSTSPKEASIPTVSISCRTICAAILLLDADSYPDVLGRFVKAELPLSPRLIVIATSAAIDSQGIGSLVREHRIVQKP